MGVVKDRGTLADNNEVLAFSSIDIEVTGVKKEPLEFP